MDNIFIIIAFTIGYYFGNRSQAREDIKRIEDLYTKQTFKVLKKKEPQSIDDERYSETKENSL